jgi:uncharacterized protein
MSLRYNVATLLHEAIGATREYDVDDVLVLDEGGQPRKERVQGTARLLRTKSGALVRAQLEGSEQTECSRCLATVTVPMRLDIEEEYFAPVDLRTGASLPAPDDADALRIDSEHTLDLEEAVRQAWTAAEPMQALCRPDCKGLCPKCGKDLNSGPCACQPDEDERWSALRQLVNQ